MKSDTRSFCPKKHMVGHPPGTGLTQLREGHRRVIHWRIVAGILALLLVQAVMGRLDAEARLADAELAAPHHFAGPGKRVAPTAQSLHIQTLRGEI